MRIRRLTALTFVFALAMGPVSWAAEIPVSSFGHVPVIEQPSVSPDGKFVAAVLNTGKIPSVAVGEFGSTDLNTILKLKYSDDRIEWIHWANSDRLLVSTSYSERSGVNRIRANRLYAVDKSGENLKPLIPHVALAGTILNRNLVHTNGDRILSFLPDEPDKILIELYDARARHEAVYKLNIHDNKFEKLPFDNIRSNRWTVDTEPRLSLGIEWDYTVKTLRYRYRDHDEGEWHKLRESHINDSETFEVLLVESGNALVLSNHASGREALWQYNLKAKQFDKVIFEAPGYDVSGVIWDPDHVRVVGATYYDHQRVDVYFDEDDQRAQQVVSKSLPGFHTTIVSRSRDRTRLIARAYRDDTPPKYIWFDTKNQSGGAWFSQYPELENLSMSPVTPFSFEASDGIEITGYITVPPHLRENSPAMVVVPHDGPETRSIQSFDPFVQFLANRGFAVLQVNHRGSWGFNLPYLEAGYREWGGRMQQDVYDAIEHVESQDLVDPNRTCIVGSGFGGFVALTAAVQKPQKFDCVVGIAGITDLVDYMSDAGQGGFDWTRKTMTIGDPSEREQKDMLEDRSPINHVGKIAAPILLIHGERDTEVRPRQSQAFYRKAKGKDRKIDYVELDLGTHYLDSNENRLAFFKAIERFLDKHLN